MDLNERKEAKIRIDRTNNINYMIELNNKIYP